jgi:Mn2+/Fe2+ NRAMP family transporter
MFNALKKVLGILGPGIVTGAADDDPCGIATYAQTGPPFFKSEILRIAIEYHKSALGE